MERTDLQTEFEILEIRKRAFENYPFSIPTLMALRAQELRVWWMQQSQQVENQEQTEKVIYKAKPSNQHKPQHRRRGGF